jgi:hypothetical protein
MSRTWYGIALLCVAAACNAQAPAVSFPQGQGTEPDVRQRNADPKAVVIPLYAGAKVSDVLAALIDKGFLIKWNPEEVLPTMTLLERPKATRIDNLLNEILKPYAMRADHNLQDGGYRVRPLKKKKKEVVIEDPVTSTQ